MIQTAVPIKHLVRENYKKGPWCSAVQDTELSKAEEYDHFKALNASFPTTLDQDVDLLSSAAMSDWRKQLLLQFRIRRKQAVAHMLRLLQPAQPPSADEL